MFVLLGCQHETNFRRSNYCKKCQVRQHDPYWTIALDHPIKTPFYRKTGTGRLLVPRPEDYEVEDNMHVVQSLLRFPLPKQKGLDKLCREGMGNSVVSSLALSATLFGKALVA